MKVNEIVKELRNSVDLNFGKRSTVFEKYRDELLRHLEDNPTDVDAISLLVVIEYELNVDADDLVIFLEDAYDSYAKNLPPEKFALLSTNLAWMYGEIYGTDSEYDLLVEAAKLGSKYPETWAGLGQILFIKGKEKEAATNFNKACRLIDEEDNQRIMLYKYNEAVCLEESGELEKAEDIYDLLSEYYIENNSTSDGRLKLEKLDYINSISLDSLFRLAAVKIKLGNRKGAKEIYDNLKRLDYDTFYEYLCDLDDYGLAGMAYELGLYDDVIGYYDKLELSAGVWMEMYFYSLKKALPEKTAQEKIERLMERTKKEIEDEINELDDTIDDSYRNIYREAKESVIEMIENQYKEYYIEGRKPETATDIQLQGFIRPVNYYIYNLEED